MSSTKLRTPPKASARILKGHSDDVSPLSASLGAKHFPSKLQCTGEADSLPPHLDSFSSFGEEPSSEMSGDESDSPSQERPASRMRRRSSSTLRAEAAMSKPSPPAAHSTKSSWADLDLSVVVALAAPIGNWLTGNDHLKNLFLILLLIIYLHQLIQVPWELYHSARARRSNPSTLPYSPSNPAIDRQVRLAATELYRHELIYLAFSAASPFLGAILLRYVLTTLNGAGTLSWFSTTLYVLATGVRPWSHLLARLRERTDSLHDAVHYPSPATQLVADTKLDALISHIEHLEEELATIKESMAAREKVEEAYDDLNTALDDVERAVRRQDRKIESSRNSQEARLNALEKTVSRVSHTKRADRTNHSAAAQYAPFPDKAGPSSLLSFLLHLMYFCWSIVTLKFAVVCVGLPSPSTKTTKTPPVSPTNPKSPVHRINSLQTLETIQEDASEGLLGETFSETEYDEDPKFVDQLVQSPVPVGEDDEPDLTRGRKKKPVKPTPQRAFVEVVQDVVVLPYHVAVRVLTAIAPPVQRLFAP